MACRTIFEFRVDHRAWSERWCGVGQVGSGATEARRSAELAAWQAVLPTLYPEIAGEAVVDVVAISSGRILLLTDAHIAMLKVTTAPDLSIGFCELCD